MSSYPGDEHGIRRDTAIGHGDPDTVTAYTSKSGAKSSEKMPAYLLIPWRPISERVARRFELGESKYGRDNWRKGLDDRAWIEDRANHAMEHLMKVLDKIRRGVRTDEGDDDLAGVAWAMFVIAEHERGDRWVDVKPLTEIKPVKEAQ